MNNPNPAFFVLGLGAALAGGVAWTSGELLRFGLASPLVAAVAPFDNAPSAAKTELSILTKSANGPANSAIDQAVLAPTRVPAFDIVRVQPDGSIVIAGRAAPGAAIDIMASGRVIGQTSTDESGSFAFVLDQPLAPGDYQIALNAKVNGETLLSEETAIVQIPQQQGGDVLAIVTASGTAPEVMAAGAVIAQNDPVALALESTQSKPEKTDVSAPKAEVAPDTVVSANPAVPLIENTAELRVEAVEIDGEKTFVAGTANAGSSVRLYLGDQLLGEARTNDAGRFLIESNQQIPVGSHMLRADALGPKGDVIARATVPFERIESAKLAFIAPIAIAEPSVETQALNQPPLTKVDTSVIIRKGDTLWQIARRVYGKGVTFSTIYNANVKQISDPDRIWPGQIFAVPRNTETGDAADFNGIEGQKKLDIAGQ